MDGPRQALRPKPSRARFIGAAVIFILSLGFGVNSLWLDAADTAGWLGPFLMASAMLFVMFEARYTRRARLSTRTDDA